jgi:PTH1 family peptidyl-tRNA hydrolase
VRKKRSKSWLKAKPPKPRSDLLKLITGLGNPGRQYVYTRHNMGWAAIDHWVLNRSLGKPASKFRGEFWRDCDCVLLKPLTYMNLSGMAVREVFDFYKMTPPDVLVVYDDIALPYGQLRLRAKGSAGGHNGLASIIACLGTLEVPRLRIGIGDSTASRVGWVLGHLNGQEMGHLPDVLDTVEDGINAWLSLDIERAMSKVNAKPHKHVEHREDVRLDEDRF